MSSRWLSLFATTFLILATTAQAKEAKGVRNETKQHHDDDMIDEILAALLQQSAEWAKEQKDSPMYQYHGLVTTVSATVEALLANGPSGGDNWVDTIETVGNDLLPFMGLPCFGDAGAIIGAVGGSVLSFLNVFSTDKADQLRAELASALPKIISQAVANSELKKGYNTAGGLLNSFRDNFVVIFQGNSGAYGALRDLNIAFDNDGHSIWGDECVTCDGSGCKWDKPLTDACRDECRAGPVPYQYSFVLLHLMVILEEAKQAPQDTRTKEYLQDKLETVIRKAAQYADLLENSMSTWAYHGLDYFNCKYDDFQPVTPTDVPQPIFVEFVADLNKDSKTTPFGVDFVDATGCSAVFGMTENKMDGYRPDPTDKPCKYNGHGYCSDQTYSDYRKQFDSDVRSAWKDLINTVKQIGELKPSMPKMFANSTEHGHADSALPSTSQSLRR